jgi:hypothetical protein
VFIDLIRRHRRPFPQRLAAAQRKTAPNGVSPHPAASEKAKLPTLVRARPALTDVAPRYAALYSVGMEPRGLHREQNGWAENEHSARVKYDEHQELDVSERHYRARGYQPPFDELPWLDEIATT